MTATRNLLSILSVLAAPILWGCSADETIEAHGPGAVKSDSTIHFAVSTDAVSEISTRGETFGSTEEFATEGRAFGVCAYDYRDDTGEVLMIGSAAGTALTGATVTCDGTDWTTDGHYYWPQTSHTVHFYAAYPVATFTRTANDVTVPLDASGDDLGDPLTAYLDMGRREAADYNYAAPLNFGHALSQISFKATTSVSGWTLTVNTITIHNLYDKGDIAIRSRMVAPNSLCLSESTTGNPSRTFTVSGNQTDALAVLPQKRAAWTPEFYTISENNLLADTAAVGTYLAIECALWDSNMTGGGGYKLGTGTDASTITTYKTIYCPVAPAWQPNMRYNYTLDFKAPGYGTSAFNDDSTPIYEVASVSLTATAITGWSDGGTSTVHAK